MNGLAAIPEFRHVAADLAARWDAGRLDAAPTGTKIDAGPSGRLGQRTARSASAVRELNPAIEVRSHTASNAALHPPEPACREQQGPTP